MKEGKRLELLKRSQLSEAEEPKSTFTPKDSELGVRLQKDPNASAFTKRLHRAGVEMDPRLFVLSTLLIAAAVGYLASLLGWLLGACTFAVLLHYLFFGYLEERAQKRKRKVIPLLPSFIDGLAAALGTGFNIDAAIVHATLGVPDGILRSELDKVSASLNAGLGVKEALSYLGERITGREITALVVCISLFASLGGHELEPFRRLAAKIREQQIITEKAGRDLIMVKQAFFIIFCLALGVPVILLLITPEYLAGAYHDAVGRIILQVGEILVLFALVGFKRMTSLRI
ncbi:MAG: type II secretion system F family protein [Oligoflexia bacterium]|nr:type II secretion system F family protein [Oligoflexia bacterium]